MTYDIIRSGIADERDEIIFGEIYNPSKYHGGIRRFETLTLKQIDELNELGVLNMNEAQNYAPSTGEIIGFLRDHNSDGWYVHGYCVSPEREDFRVTFEGIGKKTPSTKQEEIDFAAVFSDADEFNIYDNGLWCWYD